MFSINIIALKSFFFFFFLSNIFHSNCRPADRFVQFEIELARTYVRLSTPSVRIGRTLLCAFFFSPFNVQTYVHIFLSVVRILLRHCIDESSFSTHIYMQIMNQTQAMHKRSVDARAKEKKEKSNKTRSHFANEQRMGKRRRERESESEEKCNCLAHIKYIVWLVCMCGRSNAREEKRKEKVSFTKEQYDGEEKKKRRRQCKLQAKWPSSSIDRPNARDDE